MSGQFTLPASNRLRSKKCIDELFKNGRGIIVKPLRITWLTEKASESHHNGCEILVSVSKRNFKRSNKRNTIKRRLREAWRLNSVDFNHLLINNNLSLYLAIIYTDKEIVEYKIIEQSLTTAIDKINNKIASLLQTKEEHPHLNQNNN